MAKWCPVACNAETLKLQKDPGPAEECKDVHPRCPIWKDLGECEENPRDMRRYCRLSCNHCGGASDVDDSNLCADDDAQCPFWASKGECIANPNYMQKNCAKSCDTCDKRGKKKAKPKKDAGDNSEVSRPEQLILDWTETVGIRQTATGSEKQQTIDKIKASKLYWEKEATEALPADLLDKCRNQNELCSFWAVLGECEKNSAYMATNCGPACNTCHLIDINTRCPPLEDPKPGLRPGDLNKMFERIVSTAPGNTTADSYTDEVKRMVEELNTPLYTVTVHSRPSEEPATEIDAVADKSLPPWVITFDNFMTDEECEAMIQLGHKYEYKRSEDVGAEKADGTFGSVQSVRRTSENAWCSAHAGCRQEDIPDRIHKRIAEVLQIDANNSEDFQILRYEQNQFYK